MRMIKNLMEMIESSLTYFPSLRKVGLVPLNQASGRPLANRLLL
jgi:hypothetical protein